MSGRCIIVGDVMMDISAIIDSDIAYASDTPARVAFLPGGVGANTSGWMAVHGEPVTLIGAVGPDPFGQSIKSRLIDIGVDAQLIETDRPTGACVVIVDRLHERTMFPDSGANEALRLEGITSQVNTGDHLHVSGYTLVNPRTHNVVLDALAYAREVGATCSLDPASAGPIRSNRSLFDSALLNVDVLLANELEAEALTGLDDAHQALERLASEISCVVVKLGARGAIARDADGVVHEEAHATDVIDTTGAGDAFTAGFLPAWLAGGGLAKAIHRGQAVAAVAVSRVGASPLDP